MYAAISRKLVLYFCIIFTIDTVSAQTGPSIDLAQYIELANSHSLETFRAQYSFSNSYLEYRIFKKSLLPVLSLQSTPIQYNRTFVQRYDSENNTDTFKQQQSLYASAQLSVKQNVGFTGGYLFMDSGLNFLRNFGASTYNQFSSVPFRVGYSQSIMGFNPYKWNKKMEPLKYEKAKRQYIYSKQEISETATYYYFGLLMAQNERQLALEDLRSADSLFIAGKERDRISSISKEEILTLRLNVINANNALKNVETNLLNARLNFEGFCDIPYTQDYELCFPEVVATNYFSIDTAINMAREYNPDYLSYQYDVLTAEREYESMKRQSQFDASITASIGFNQAADNFINSYRHPLQQDFAQISFSIPIVDWNSRKAKVKIANNNLDLVKRASEFNEKNLERNIIVAVSEYNDNIDIIRSAEQAHVIAVNAYNISKQRYIVGMTDLNSLILARNRRAEANRYYITSLYRYWMSYYKICKLTLFDFITNQPLSVEFDQLIK